MAILCVKFVADSHMLLTASLMISNLRHATFTLQLKVSAIINIMHSTLIKTN